jgi:hypothetical protein
MTDLGEQHIKCWYYWCSFSILQAMWVSVFWCFLTAGFPFSAVS